jgi:hypothetical protein
VPIVSSAVVSSQEHSAKNCKSTVVVNDVLTAAMGEGVSRAAVFVNGQFYGWRLSGSPRSERERRIPDNSLVTRICGVPASEIKGAESVCCSASLDESIVISVDVNGKARDVPVTANNSLQADRER